MRPDDNSRPDDHNHDSTDHGQADHRQANHRQADHGQADHGQTDHRQADHRQADHGQAARGAGEPPHTHPHPDVDPHPPLAGQPGSAAGAGAARAVRIGIGGPVGSGKTALVAALCKALGDELRLAVVTNDIYTTEDADFLLRHGVLPAERIRAVATGCCPHTAIRDDISANLDAVEELEATLGPLDLVLVESGGDNLTATFSKGLIDQQIFVIDVAGGDKVPRKGGPGVTSADLLVINKTDLAPLVGADLSVMDRDATARRGALPTVFLSLVRDPAATEVAQWVRSLTAPAGAGSAAADPRGGDPARATTAGVGQPG